MKYTNSQAIANKLTRLINNIARQEIALDKP